MEIQSLIDIALSTVLFVLGWFAREMWSAVKELQKDIAQLREALPREYVPKNEYREDIRDLKLMLEKIFDEMKHKVDK